MVRLAGELERSGRREAIGGRGLGARARWGCARAAGSERGHFACRVDTLFHRQLAALSHRRGLASCHWFQRVGSAQVNEGFQQRF